MPCFAIVAALQSVELNAWKMKKKIMYLGAWEYKSWLGQDYVCD